MEVIKSWKKALNVSEADYQQWQSICGTEESITSWALKNNKLPSQAYMSWALAYYKIPMIKKEFFYNASVQNLWNQVKEKAKWNEFFLPVYQWEDIIYAGCVEPPEQLNSQIVALLVHPEQLQSTWKRIQLGQKTTQTQLTQMTQVAQPTQSSQKEESSEKTKTQITLLTKLQKWFSNTNSQQKSNKLSSAPSINEPKYLNILEEAQKLFLFSMVLSYSNSQFTPIKWSSTVAGSKNPIHTKEPSIFRIVRKSLRPYHGFVIENKQHNDFFKQFGFQPVPQHVTLSPIFRPYHKKELIGAFMGVAQTSIHPMKIPQITNWCKSLSRLLTSEKKTVAS